MNRKRMFTAGSALLAAAFLGGTANAEPTTESDLSREIASLRREVAELRGASQESWLNDRRREEVRQIVQEVMADAETRSSLAGEGAVAGYDGKNFFLASEDGKFRLNFDGQVQFRYIHNQRHEPNATGSDDEESGFQMRRAKVGFSGHVGDPRLEYKIKAGFDRGDGDFVLEEAYAKYKLSDQHYIQLGQFKARFNREELVSSTAQLAVERSNVNEFFTIDYAQGIELGGQYDKFNWSVAIHDGREQDNTEFSADSTDFAVAGRVELLVAGDWKQFKDFTAWSSEKFGVLLGAGADYAQMDHGRATASPLRDYLQFTGDVSIKAQPVGFYFAFIGRQGWLDDDGALTGREDVFQWGMVAQASVFVIPDKMDLFARWEHLDQDDLAEFGHSSAAPAFLGGAFQENEADIFTFGTNYYMSKHASKVTADVQWYPDGITSGESGGGSLPTLENGAEFVFRFQYQLLF